MALREYTSTSSTVYFLVADHLGSTRVVTQATGALVSELRYSAYGEQRSKIATVGLYHYGARWFNPQLAHFTQADTIVPGVYNPADWNRFAYVKYNPVNSIDPTGHSVDCSFGEYGCRNGQLYPEGIINLYYQSDRPNFDNLICESCQAKREMVSKELDDFLKKNPAYDTLQEIYRVGIEREFNDLRYEYWVNRENVSKGEAFNLRDYYDFHQTWDVQKFDSSKVNWSDVALDGASFLLGFFGLNEFTESLKIPISVQKNAIRAGTGLNVITTANSAINGDPVGTTLGIAGFIPGPVGIFASGASLSLDFGKAFYFVQYEPSIPR